MGISASSVSPAGQVTSHITSKITGSATCDDNDTTKAVAKNLQINLSHIDCNEVNVVMLSTLSDAQCASTIAYSAAGEHIAKRLAAAAATSKVTAVTLPDGQTSISASDKNVQAKVSQAFKQACGNNDHASTYLSDVSINMNGVTCDQLNVVQSKSSLQTVCTLRMFQDTMDKNKALAEANPDASAADTLFTSTNLIIGLGCLGAFAAVVIVVLVLHYRHKHRARARAARAGRHGHPMSHATREALRHQAAEQAKGVPAAIRAHAKRHLQHHHHHHH